MDFNSYAELAVRLVNTAGGGGEDGADRLANLDGLRALVADREHLNTGMTRNDLDAQPVQVDQPVAVVAPATGRVHEPYREFSVGVEIHSVSWPGSQARPSCDEIDV